MNQIRFGVLSTAKIGIEKVIPAMQQGSHCTVSGIASRSADRAKRAAGKLELPNAYGSYQELLDDPAIDAIYNPLPNHLHVPWTIKALEAGKHVLCEKPVALSSGQAQELKVAAEAHPHLKVMEAFMYRFHPQWRKTKELVERQKIGELRTIHSFFSYFNDDPENIRNFQEYGGGGLMDIGCYCISLSRFLFDREPRSVQGTVEYDPRFGVDRLASGMLDFEGGTSTFTCSTQLTPSQGVTVYGTGGKIEIEIPFNAPPDKPTRIWLYRNGTAKKIEFPVCDQYTIQGDLFSKAVLDDREVPTPLTDAIDNMKVIEAVFKSDETGTRVEM